MLALSYRGSIQGERYAFLVLDIEQTPFYRWSRCAILSKIELWPSAARKMISELSQRTIEIRTGEESSVEELLPNYEDELVSI